MQSVVSRALTVSLLFIASTHAQSPTPTQTTEQLLDHFTFRNLGPFRAGAWVADIAVPETPAKAHAHTFYAGARTGGVWKTINSGTTFQQVSDSAGIESIGAIAVAPSNPDVVWVGEGDASATRSAYYGRGVFRSIDGAKTWQLMGLRDTRHIARIVIHPTNPNIVWIAALGHLYTTNEDRGVYKTTDGGKSWSRVLYVDEHSGAVDLVIDHGNPDVLYAATYDMQRFPWKIRDGGPGSAIWKTIDGGVNWTRLAGGLPTGTIGRIGIDICRSHPNVLYAVLDNFNGKRGGEVYRTTDSGATWTKRNAEADDVSRKTGYAFNQIRVDPNNSERIFITGSNLIESDDGGRTWQGLNGAGGAMRPLRRAFGDFRSLWIDPADSDHMIAASDGGVSVSYDGGKTCDALIGMQLGEVYAIGADMENPYHIFEGLQDHESWMAPVNGPHGSVGIEDWTTVGIGDGMYQQPDPKGRYTYNTQEFGTPARIDLVDRTRTVITPPHAAGAPPLRVNWTAPLRLSPHDSNTIYFGAQMLWRSKDRGDHWEEISPDLTTNDPARISGPGTGIQHCTITTIAESPVKPGMIWVGTDDGRIALTTTGGAGGRPRRIGGGGDSAIVGYAERLAIEPWVHLDNLLPTLKIPANAWVTRILPSPHDANVAFITFSNRRADDYHPYAIRVTLDGTGITSRPIHIGLPEGAVNVIVEDPQRKGLLFAGTDSGIYVSFDAGNSWTRFNANVPPAPVHDLLIHPREGDLIVGTFGRGVWVTNITPLREFHALTADAHLFAINPFAERREVAWGNYRLYGDRMPVTPNEPNGARIAYYTKSAGKAEISIADASGKTIRKYAVTAKAGMNWQYWMLDDDAGAPVAAGDYVVTLQSGTTIEKQTAKILSRVAEDFPRPRRFGRGGDNDSEP